MSEPRRLARFTKEVSASGVLDQMLDQLPPEEVARSLAAMAHDRGYSVRVADLQVFLAGLDVRQR